MNCLELFTTDEVAESLSVASRTIFEWRKNRGFPFVRLGPKLIRYDIDAVESWLESQGK